LEIGRYVSAAPPGSRWARRIGQADWLLAEGAARPLFRAWRTRGRFRTIWGRCQRRAARSAPARGAHNRPALQQALARHLIEHRGAKTEPRQIIARVVGASGDRVDRPLLLKSEILHGWRTPAMAARAWRLKRSGPASSVSR
jgi:hypothetical protein